MAELDPKVLRRRLEDLEREVKRLRGDGRKISLTAGLDMGRHEITNLAEPQSLSSAATKKTIDSEVSGKSIVTTVTEPTLPKHRVLTGSAAPGIVVTDDFPLNTVTLTLDTNNLDIDGFLAEDLLGFTWFMFEN